MNMHIETKNRKAFELVTEALRDIDLYKNSKEQTQLELAKAKLEQAISEDPKYLRAFYYSAMVNDLIGKAKDAIEQFEKVLQESPPFIEEVRYNLGIAYYHRYSWPYLEKAAEHFKTVIRNTKDPILKLLAQAGLAQTYAMRMIQPDPREPDREDAQKYFNFSKEQYDLVMAGLEKLEGVDEETLNEIKWTTYNAQGMSLIYHTDYFGITEKKVDQLRHALGELRKADKHSPKNWANYCDLGSAHMRLGHWLGSQSNFEEALKYLYEVISKLRPYYGFALYEIGRIYRLMGEFERAVEYFNKSLEIPYDYRDVSDRRVNLEKERAMVGSKEYP